MPDPLKEVNVHWALTQRTFDRGKLNHMSINNGGHLAVLCANLGRTSMDKALEQAKKLITDMLHSQGLDSDWRPDRPGRRIDIDSVNERLNDMHCMVLDTANTP